MRLDNHNGREITVKKDALLEKIRANKKNHISEYEKAVKAYKIKAKRVLQEQTQALKKGSLKININLVAPSNKTEEYDKIAAMFEWELADEIKLSQGEFNEYVLDETAFAREAKFLNNTYLAEVNF